MRLNNIPVYGKTLQDLINTYNDYSKTKKTKGGYDIQQYHIKNLLKHITPKTKLFDITRLDFEKYRQVRFNAKIKPATLNREFTTFKSMFNRAVEWSYLSDNPVKHIKPLSTTKNPPKFLSKQEVEKIVSVAKVFERDIFLFLRKEGAG
jgi:site-specific recombinase XerD